MRSIYILCLLLIARACCTAQSISKGGPEKSNFYQEIPYELINGKIIIPVEIAGHSYRFLLDTGAPFTISDEIAAQLGITASNQSNSIDAYGNTSMVKTASVSNIKLGDVNFKNIPAFIGSNMIYKCLGINGNIGSNLLRSTIITFNSPKKTLTITDDLKRLDLKAENSIPLNIKKDNSSSPYFVLEVAPGVTGDFFIDTGDSGFMSLSNTYFNIFKAHNAGQILATGYGSNSFGQNGAENNNVKHRVLFPAVKIGRSVFKNVRTETVFNDAGSGNNSIGTRLLDHGVLTLDYLHNKLYFDAFQPEADLAEKSWSLSPSFNNGQLIIGVVWGSLKDTIKPGQQITAIDGLACDHVELCTLFLQGSILQGRDNALLTIKDENGKYTQLRISKE